jgi:cytochrome P450
MPRGNRAWMITRYEDVRAALADPRLLKDPHKLPDGGQGVLGSHLLSTDPPDHTRLRRLVAAAFTARRVEGMRPRIAAITTDLLDAMDGCESADLVSSFAFPLPVTVGLSESELISMLFLLMVTGHASTVNLIASGMLALLTHPSQMARLRRDPSLLPSAVEELLRFISPVNHTTFRFTGCPVAVGNVLIPAGQPVVAAISSANRDPAQFDSPETLDLSRDTSGHLAFGHGIHYCLGAKLARLVGAVAFGELLSRFPDMRLAIPEESLRWRASFLVRELESLPVRLG